MNGIAFIREYKTKLLSNNGINGEKIKEMIAYAIPIQSFINNMH